MCVHRGILDPLCGWLIMCLIKLFLSFVCVCLSVLCFDLEIMGACGVIYVG